MTKIIFGKQNNEEKVEYDKVKKFIQDQLDLHKPKPMEVCIKTIRIYDREENYKLIKAIALEQLPNFKNQRQNLPSVI